MFRNECCFGVSSVRMVGDGTVVVFARTTFLADDRKRTYQFMSIGILLGPYRLRHLM